jgi:hypothetical protein
LNSSSVETTGNTGSSDIVLLADILARSNSDLVLECNEEREETEKKLVEQFTYLSCDTWKNPRCLQYVNIWALVLVNTVVVLVINGLYVMSVIQQRRRAVLSGINSLASFIAQDWVECSNQSCWVVWNVEYLQ